MPPAFQSQFLSTKGREGATAVLALEGGFIRAGAAATPGGLP